MLNRHNNPLWPQLAEDRLHASSSPISNTVTADFENHCPRQGTGRLIITSDAVHIAGMKPGRYDLAGMPVELLKTGRIRLSGTDLLAGSATTFCRAAKCCALHRHAQRLRCAPSFREDCLAVIRSRATRDARASFMVLDISCGRSTVGR